MANPFAPIALGSQAAWSAHDHQNAANFYWYEMMGANEKMAGPNYKPLWQGMKAAFEEHSRAAKAKRNAK